MPPSLTTTSYPSLFLPELLFCLLLDRSITFLYGLMTSMLFFLLLLPIKTPTGHWFFLPTSIILYFLYYPYYFFKYIFLSSYQSFYFVCYWSAAWYFCLDSREPCSSPNNHSGRPLIFSYLKYFLYFLSRFFFCYPRFQSIFMPFPCFLYIIFPFLSWQLVI